MSTVLYIRNRREAALIAAIAQEFGIHTSVRDIYRHDRYLLNIADRLFGVGPDRVGFVRRAMNELLALRKARQSR